MAQSAKEEVQLKNGIIKGDKCKEDARQGKECFKQLMFLKSFIGWMPPKLDKAKRDLGGDYQRGFYRSPPTPFHPFSPTFLIATKRMDEI